LKARGFTEIAAAGIVGNMWVETDPKAKFDHTTVTVDTDKYIAGGLCCWNDRYGNLTHLLEKRVDRYGQKESDGSIKRIAAGLGLDGVKKKLAEIGVDYQLQFIDETIPKVTVSAKDTTQYSKAILNAKTTPSEAAESFRAAYERGADAKLRKEKAEEFYKAYKNGAGTTKAKPASTEKTNNATDYSKQFVAAIQKSLNTTENYKGELNPVYGNDGLVTITMKDNNREKLAVLFDIILNSDSYYNQTFGLQWVYSGAPSELPTSLKVTPKPSVESNKRRIFIHDGTPKSMNGKLTGEECNEKLMQSLSKRYGSNKNTFVLECPQFSNNSDAIDKFKAASCGSLFNGNEGKSEKGSEVAKSAKITIDGWDVEKAVAQLNKAGTTTKHQCAAYVERAIAAGGGPLKNKISTHENNGNSDHATNLRYYGILESHGFVQITPNNATIGANGNPNIELQAGDVSIIGKNAKLEGGKYHACMWSGTQWISDFKQKNMNVYGSSQPYAIYRFHNKKGTAKA